MQTYTEINAGATVHSDFKGLIVKRDIGAGAVIHVRKDVTIHGDVHAGADITTDFGNVTVYGKVYSSKDHPTKIDCRNAIVVKGTISDYAEFKTAYGSFSGSTIDSYVRVECHKLINITGNTGKHCHFETAYGGVTAQDIGANTTLIAYKDISMKNIAEKCTISSAFGEINAGTIQRSSSLSARKNLTVEADHPTVKLSSPFGDILVKGKYSQNTSTPSAKPHHTTNADTNNPYSNTNTKPNTMLSQDGSKLSDALSDDTLASLLKSGFFDPVKSRSTPQSQQPNPDRMKLDQTPGAHGSSSSHSSRRTPDWITTLMQTSGNKLTTTVSSDRNGTVITQVNLAGARQGSQVVQIGPPAARRNYPDVNNNNNWAFKPPSEEPACGFFDLPNESAAEQPPTSPKPQQANDFQSKIEGLLHDDSAQENQLFKFTNSMRSFIESFTRKEKSTDSNRVLSNRELFEQHKINDDATLDQCACRIDDEVMNIPVLLDAKNYDLITLLTAAKQADINFLQAPQKTFRQQPLRRHIEQI